MNQSLFLDSERDLLTVDNTTIPLSRIEVHLLRKFVNQMGSPVHKKELAWIAWGVTELTPTIEQNLYVLISRLRKKVRHPIIKTISGFGYMLIKPIEQKKKGKIIFLNSRGREAF